MASKLFHSVVIVGTTMASGLTVSAVGMLTACSSSSVPDAPLNHIAIDAGQPADANLGHIGVPDAPRPDAQLPDANLNHISPGPVDARAPDANFTHISPGPLPADARVPDANLVAIMPGPVPGH